MKKKYTSDYFRSMAFSQMVFKGYENIDTSNLVVTTYQWDSDLRVTIVEHDRMDNAFTYLYDLIKNKDNDYLETHNSMAVNIDYKIGNGYLNILSAYGYGEFKVKGSTTVTLSDVMVLRYNDNTFISDMEPEKFAKIINMDKLMAKI